MKMRYLAGCAAVAIAMGAGAAFAQDFKVTLSGDIKFQAAFATEERNQDSRAVDFRNRFRLWIDPEAKAFDGALTYGASLRMLAADSDGRESYDRALVYAKGAFGTVSAGTMSTYSDDWNNRGSTAMQRPADWHTEDDIGFGVAAASKDPAYTASSASKLESWRDKALKIGGDRSTKIRYATPVIYGVQLAAAYAPQGKSSYTTPSTGIGWDFDRSKGTEFQDAGEVALLFNSADKTIADKFGDAYLNALVDYQFASNGLTNMKSHSAIQAGLVVGYQGFRVGGEYLYFGKSGLYKYDTDQTNRYAWNFGAQYKFDAFYVGAGYNYAEKDAGLSSSANTTSGSGKKTSQAFSLGGRYTAAKGLDLYVDYAHVVNKNTLSGYSDAANVVGLSANIAF